MWILQTLAAVFLALHVRRLDAWAVGVGSAVVTYLRRATEEEAEAATAA